MRCATRGELLEANEVHGNWYGTPRDQVRAGLAVGKDVILKIDVQGAQVVKEQVTQALLIFVVPPSMEALFQRLRARATETADELELRQRNAALELARQRDYDRVVTNETGQVEEHRGEDRADHRAGAPPTSAPPASASRQPMDATLDVATVDRAPCRRRDRCPAAADPGPTRTRFRATSTTSFPARRSSWSSADVRRSGSSPPKTLRRRTASSRSRSRPGFAPMARCSRHSRCRSPRGSPITTWRRRHSSFGRCCRRASSSGSSSSRSERISPRPTGNRRPTAISWISSSGGPARFATSSPQRDGPGSRADSGRSRTSAC